MTSQAVISGKALGASRGRRVRLDVDVALLLGIATLFGLGMVMVASASTSVGERQFGDPFHFLARQGAYAGVSVMLGLLVWRVPLSLWERAGGLLLLTGGVLLIAVLIPGIGKEVNGSTRWLSVGPLSLQPSEFIKLFIIVYLAGYLVRRYEEVRSSVLGFLKPVALLALVSVLLLLEPDFGAAAVIFVTALGMLFLGGVRLWQFGLLVTVIMGLLFLVAQASPYRLERLTAFLNPWADPYASGFQLTQALIAFGRGEWLGVGLGGSVQKLFYLPEAHTDFVFAVLAEELGLVGSLAVIVLFLVIVLRGFAIGAHAERREAFFATHLAHGLSLWLATQAFVNIGVNTGVLPTKGLTLPLLSYGGSSLLVTCIALGLLLRIDLENRSSVAPVRRAERRRWR